MVYEILASSACTAFAISVYNHMKRPPTTTQPQLPTHCPKCGMQYPEAARNWDPKKQMITMKCDRMVKRDYIVVTVGCNAVTEYPPLDAERTKKQKILEEILNAPPTI